MYKDKVICLIENTSVVRKKCTGVGIDKDVQVLCLIFEDGSSTFVANDLIRFNNYNDDFWEEMNLGASSRAKDRYNWFMIEESYDKLYENDDDGAFYNAYFRGYERVIGKEKGIVGILKSY